MITAPMTPTITTSSELNRSATSVMPNGAGHDADLQHLDAVRLARERASRSPADQDASAPPNATDRSSLGRCGSSCSAIAVASGSRIGRASSISGPPLPRRQQRLVGPNRVDVVRAGGLVDAVRQHQRKREHAEADDDRSQDQRLRNRIGERRRRNAVSRNERRAVRASPPPR